MKCCLSCGLVKPPDDYYAFRNGALHPRCKPCARERQRRNDEGRVAERRTYNNQRYAQQRDDINRRRRENRDAKRAEYLLIHGERLAGEKAERGEARRLKRLDYSRSYYEAQRAEILARKQRIYDSGPDVRIASAEKERRKRAALRQLPQERYTTELVIAHYGLTCWLCERPISPVVTEARLAFTVDHLIPIMVDPWQLAALGMAHPGDLLVNVAPAHKGCNSGKSNKLLPEAIARYLANLQDDRAGGTEMG